MNILNIFRRCDPSDDVLGHHCSLRWRELATWSTRERNCAWGNSVKWHLQHECVEIDHFSERPIFNIETTQRERGTWSFQSTDVFDLLKLLPTSFANFFSTHWECHTGLWTGVCWIAGQKANMEAIWCTNWIATIAVHTRLGGLDCVCHISFSFRWTRSQARTRNSKCYVACFLTELSVTLW
jgi:hypothetical protein